MRTKKYRLLAAAALVVIVTGFSACLKSDNPEPQRPWANVLFVNAFVGPDLDVSNAGTKLNNEAFGLGDLMLKQPYRGVYDFTYKKYNADSLIASTGPITIDSLAYYTMVVYGQQPVRVRALRDDFTGLTNDKINFRFFHLSPNTPAVDLYLNDTKIDSNVVYESGIRPTFSALTSSLYNPRLSVKLAGTNTEVATTNSSDLNVGVQPGGVYTFFLTGLTGATGAQQLKVNNAPSYY
jgi:hypothetical protein